MNIFKFSKKVFLIFLIPLFFSCVPKKDILHYQNIESMAQEKGATYEIKIQPDDLLIISVSAEDSKVTAPFNLNPSNVISGGAQAPTNKSAVDNYLVDADGFIDFPELGKLKVSGLTRSEVLALFKKKLSAYIKNPIITLRIENFKVVVQGDVSAPGVFQVKSDRFTLIEALTMAGDLKITSRRDNILVIREIDGVKSYHRVDIRKADFINSPFYYMAQNDVVYVEPKYKTISPNVTLVTSIASIGLTLLSFLLILTR
ncbi:polysaccharide biosynthesis/export family protein [Flavobacterium sp.]|uniref:polysaccharide biosynthesis/export family protein n=1 Tax=Flavobacterium sp. TaxID=239 RepID=UPI00261A37F6|nr:polysaccharide biosynthesis/export family protein [Flavobacterium sp.]MDG2433651.1 polysaccharide biosynthesis/export family protein [Flavobacterium sp.]